MKLHIKIILIFLVFTCTITFASNENEIAKKKIPLTNIWLKTYSNYKNYNTILNNINKVEQEISRLKNRNNQTKIQELNNKLNIYKSKLTLYEKKNSFD